jgi:hypothetical protein
MLTQRNKILAVAGLAIVALGGGWLLAKHQAYVAAKDGVDGFIIRHNLTGRVSYGDLSASPFGSATLSDVTVTLSPSAAITIGSLSLADVTMKNDQFRGFSLTAEHARFPLLALAREQRNGQFADAIGMGYTTLTGKVSLSVHYDDEKNSLTLETATNVDDAGSWEAKIKLGGISPVAVDSLAGIANLPSQQPNWLQAMQVAGPLLQTLGGLTVAKMEMAVNIDGIRKRDAQVTNQDLPPEGAGAVAPGMSADDEMKLVRAGMAPSEAQAARDAVQSWLAKGGTLQIATNLDQPLPVFRNGNILTPSFDGFEGYMAATKSHVSN